MFTIHQADFNICPKVELYNKMSDSWLVRWQGINEGDVVETIIAPFPSLEDIKRIILEWHNEQINEEIRSGHKWREMPVWLSSENQQNYKASYDLVQQLGGQMGTLPLTYKFGTELEPVYHEFSSVDELSDFYLSTVAYVKNVLAEGWRRKDAIDWSQYEEILKQHE